MFHRGLRVRLVRPARSNSNHHAHYKRDADGNAHPACVRDSHRNSDSVGDGKPDGVADAEPNPDTHTHGNANDRRRRWWRLHRDAKSQRGVLVAGCVGDRRLVSATTAAGDASGAQVTDLGR